MLRATPVWPRASLAELVPRPGALDLWSIDIARAASDEDWALLSADERAKAQRIIVDAKKTQAVRARAELRRILAHYLGERDPAALAFSYGEHGKPTLAARFGLGPTFNLSHSGEVALVGIVIQAGTLRLGVDIELAKRERAVTEIAESFFAADELVDFAARPLHERVDAFYRFWACKEAYLKALGTGLSFSSQGFSIALDPSGPWLRSTTRVGDRPQRWRMLELPCPTGYAAAACWDGPELELRRFAGPTSPG